MTSARRAPEDRHESGTTPIAPARGRGLRRGPRVWRGFLVGLVLLPLNALWVLCMEHIGAHGPIPSTISLFFNVVFILFFLAIANAVTRRLRPRWALNQAELIIVYVMLTIGTSLAGLEKLQSLLDSGKEALFQVERPSGILVDVNDAACQLLDRIRGDLLETSFCENELDLFGALRERSLAGEYAKCVDPNYASLALRFPGPVDLETLEAALRGTGDALFRAKGFAEAEGGTVYVDYSAAGFRSEPRDAPATGLECIVSGPRLEEVRAVLAVNP